MADLQIILLLFTLVAVSLSWGNVLTKRERFSRRLKADQKVMFHSKDEDPVTQILTAEELESCFYYDGLEGFHYVKLCTDHFINHSDAWPVPPEINFYNNLKCCLNNTGFAQFDNCTFTNQGCSPDQDLRPVAVCCISNSNTYSDFRTCLGDVNGQCSGAEPTNAPTEAPANPPTGNCQVLDHGPAQGDTEKIVGGVEAVHSELPPMTLVVIHRNDSRNYMCGGAIIDRWTILTAAHCVDGMITSNSYVVVGEHDWSQTSGHEQTIDVAGVINHPHYVTAQHGNDVALLILSSAIQFEDNHIAPACVPDQNVCSNPGTNCTVSGWGSLSYNGSLSTTLQKAYVTIVSDAECNSNYSAFGGIDGDTMVCAGAPGKDSCQGDSGGPLTCDGVLTGVVSYGHECAVPGYPGVYAEVCKFGDWIRANMETANNA